MTNQDRVLLIGFDAHTVAALRDLGAPPAVWIRKAAVQPGEAESLGTKILTMTTETVDPRHLNTEELQRASDLLREMFRRSADRITTYAPASSWTTHESRMRLMLHYVADLLDRERINRVIFHIIPHEPFGLVVEALCRARGIDILMGMQSQFPNRFFMFKELSEFGSLSVKADYSLKPPPFPTAPSSPFYMKKTFEASKWKFHGQRLRHYAHFLLRLALLPFAGYRKFYKTMHKAYYITETYKLHTRRYVDEPDLKCNFIYLPLHLQPELTVDVMGGIYGDQALVAETLARAAPEGWLIYVKENPKQSADAREEAFFQRLQALPNVRLISPKTDTFSLIKASRCVATCTGTAGWEALLLGIPAIAFGAAWWRKLPGAFEWQDHLDIAGIAQFKIERPELEAAFNKLSATMKQGVVDQNYAQLVSDFNPEANGRSIAEAILASSDSKHDAILLASQKVNGKIMVYDADHSTSNADVPVAAA